MTYVATIQHHSISHAPKITFEAMTLGQAKRRATAEFGDGFRGYTIVLFEVSDYDGGLLPVAHRTISNRHHWHNDEFA